MEVELRPPVPVCFTSRRMTEAVTFQPGGWKILVKLFNALDPSAD